MKNKIQIKRIHWLTILFLLFVLPWYWSDLGAQKKDKIEAKQEKQVKNKKSRKEKKSTEKATSEKKKATSEKEKVTSEKEKATSAEEEPEIIEESDSNEKEEKGLNYWDEHFRAILGFSHSFIFRGESYRSYAFAGLNWQHKFRYVNFTVELLFFRRDYQYLLQLAPTDRELLDRKILILERRLADTEYPPTQDERGRFVNRLTQLQRQKATQEDQTTLVLGLENNNLLIPEANIKFKFQDKFELLLGYHTVVWGQLDFLSPVDFLLPFRIGSSGLGFSKAELRNPQLTALLAIFPVKWLELQFYFFPLLDLDSAIVSLYDTAIVQARSEYVRAENFDFPRGVDAFRYAARVLFYLERLTLGFTYYRGYLQFGQNSNSTLQTAIEHEQEVLLISSNPTLNQIDAVGTEISIPLGKWILKFDSVYYSSFDSINLNVNDFNAQTLGYLDKDEAFEKRQLVAAWIFNQNQGSLDYREHAIISTIGVDANLQRWLLNLGVIFLGSIRSSSAQEGLELYKDAENVEESLFASSDFFAGPVINIAYYLDKLKKTPIGIAGGLLNGGVGVIGYISSEFFEALRIGLSVEFTGLFTDQIIQLEGYEQTSFFYPGMRLIMKYFF